MTKNEKLHFLKFLVTFEELTPWVEKQNKDEFFFEHLQFTGQKELVHQSLRDFEEATQVKVLDANASNITVQHLDIDSILSKPRKSEKLDLTNTIEEIDDETKDPDDHDCEQLLGDKDRVEFIEDCLFEGQKCKRLVHIRRL